MLLLGVGAAAGAAGLGLTGCSGGEGDALTLPAPPPLASSTALPLSRRADPSLDRYTRTPRRRTATRSLNGAQLWLSERERPLVAHDSDPTVSLNAVGWGTKPAVDVYVNATGVNAYNPLGLRDARRWLVRRGGTPVKVDGWLMLDIRQPAARRWWLLGSDGKVSCNPERLRRSALDLIACGYHGLWVDNVLQQPAQWFKPDPEIDAAQWGNALVALLQELRNALPAGTPFTINQHWTDTDWGFADDPVLQPDSSFVRAAKLADQLVIEGGAVDPGINYAGSAADDWSYRRLLGYADALHGQGVRLQWEKTGSTDLTRNDSTRLGALPSCRDGDLGPRQPGWRKGDPVWQAHVRTAAFNAASALLTVGAGDGLGDMCEYPGRGWRGYGIDLGAPLGPRTESGGVIMRSFERGFVAVNPSSGPITFAVPDGRAVVDLATTTSATELPAAVSRFTLEGRRAVFGTATPAHSSTGAPATAP